MDFSNTKNYLKECDQQLLSLLGNSEDFIREINRFQQDGTLSAVDFNRNVLDPLLHFTEFLYPSIWAHCIGLWSNETHLYTKAHHWLEILLETEKSDEELSVELTGEQTIAFETVFQSLPLHNQCDVFVRSLSCHRMALGSIVKSMFDRLDWNYYNNVYRADETLFYTGATSLINCVRTAFENTQNNKVPNAEQEFLQMCAHHENANQLIFDLLHLIVVSQCSAGIIPSDMQTNVLSEYLLEFVGEDVYPFVLNLYEVHPSPIGLPFQLSRYNLERELKENLVEPLKTKKLNRI